MAKRIETAGELRGFLADILVGIRNGTVEPDQANAISKVAAQINSSIATEVHARLSMKDMKGETAGSMVITAEPPAAPQIEDAWVWCAQCDKRVSKEFASQCESKFCKAKA